MKIKRYVAANMRIAMNHIAEELGADAVILSSKQLDEGVEVMAAVDFDESVFNPSYVKKVKVATPEKEEQQVRAVKKDQEEWLSDPAITMMQDRIKNLEGLLKEHLNYQKWKDIEITSPSRAEVIKRLVLKGFHSGYIKEIIQNIPDQPYFEIAWQEMQNELAQRIKISADPIVTEPGLYAFVGTTGVGKTTTVAKLAARYALKHGHEDIGLITTDIYRIAAKEQLSVYAKILNIPVAVAESESQLQQALHRFKRKKIILIDTAGFSQKDPKFKHQINMIQSGVPQVNFISVLSAVTDLHVQKEITQCLQSVDIHRAIISKLDEASSLGALLSMLMQEKIILSYLCVGQRVPEDIVQANAKDLIRTVCQSEDILTIEDSLEDLTEVAQTGHGEQHVSTVC